MNRTTPFLLGAAIVALPLLGCARSSPTMPSTSSAARGSLAANDQTLDGTWNVVSIQRAGQAVQPAPTGVPYTVTFAESRVSTHVDCNTCGGTYAVSGQTLTVGPALACTRAACPTMDFENTYTALLGGDSEMTMSGGTLVLASPRGVVRLAR